MPDIPREAFHAAARAHECAWVSGATREDLVLATLEAAAPGIAAQVRREDEEQREQTRILDRDLAEAAEGNHGAPDLVERMALAIPVRLVKSEAVGIGGARREYIARAVLPVVQNELERARADERRKFEELLGAVWLYIGWRDVTGHLTTEQKDLFADAVDAYWSRSDAFEGEESTPVDRWWVDDVPARQIGETSDSR